MMMTMTTKTVPKRPNRIHGRNAPHGATIMLGLLLALFVGCATMGAGPPSTSFKIAGNVPDATVWIDDHLVGRVSELAKSEKRLPLGFHRLEVRAPGFYSFFQEVDAQAGAAVIVRADLHELLQ
jgi:hypothetical protein